MILVPLTQEKVALIDDADAECVLVHKWCAKRDGHTFYAMRKTKRVLGGRTVYMHSILMPMPQAGHSIDHINGNGLDNRRCNLRYATKQQQNFNARPHGGRSVYKGVSWEDRVAAGRASCWLAQIQINGKSIKRRARSELEAAALYNILAREHFGEYARLNDLGEMS